MQRQNDAGNMQQGDPGSLVGVDGVVAAVAQGVLRADIGGGAARE